jgi:glycosyltransferase involved in cell wall biosynthesis
MSQPPLVSVVIATRDRPELLQRAVRSILRQTLQEIEIIAVDDGSPRETVMQCAAEVTAIDPRVAFHIAALAPVPARGISESRNYGLSLARAPYTVFFDDDDEMSEPGHLETAAGFLRQYPGTLYLADIRSVDNGRIVSESRMRAVEPVITQNQISADPPVFQASIAQFAKAITHRYPHFNAALLDTALVREIGGFMGPLFLAEDVNLFLRYADRCTAVIYRRQAVVDFDVTPRPRAFNILPPHERDIIACMALSQARTRLSNPHLHRAARHIEAFLLASAAGKMNAQGNRLAARALARQSLALRPTRDGLRQWAASRAR